MRRWSESALGTVSNPTAPGLKLFSDLPQHSDRIIHMLEDMIAQQHIKGLLRMKVFEKRMHYLVSIRRIIRFIDHLLASFDYQQALKQVGHPLGNVAIPEPQL